MLQQILKERGLSIYWLSKASGVPYTTVSLLCRGKTGVARCDVGTVYRICRVLRVKVEELMTPDELKRLVGANEQEAGYEL
jgi:DNA-binding Xre family transcriptional regulator